MEYTERKPHEDEEAATFSDLRTDRRSRHRSMGSGIRAFEYGGLLHISIGIHAVVTIRARITSHPIVTASIGLGGYALLLAISYQRSVSDLRILRSRLRQFWASIEGLSSGSPPASPIDFAVVDWSSRVMTGGISDS